MSIDFEIMNEPAPGLELIEAIRSLEVNTHIRVPCENVRQANHYRTFMSKVRNEGEGQQNLHSRLLRQNGSITICFYREASPSAPAA